MEVLGHIACLCNQLWGARNRCLSAQSRWSGFSVAASAHSMHEMFLSVHQQPTRDVQPGVRSLAVRWQPPLCFVKMNMDAGVIDSDTMGLGVIFHNHLG